jgi:inositol oxygenase
MDAGGRQRGSGRWVYCGAGPVVGKPESGVRIHVVNPGAGTPNPREGLLAVPLLVRPGEIDNVATDHGSTPMPTAATYRDYESASDRVRGFYALNHANQTLAFAQDRREQYGRLDKRRMGVWEACEYLNELIDDSDPDTSLSQIAHCLQTAEAIRADGHPDWFVLAGLVHDLGKILCLFGEPQWAVTGDTFPLGCRFQDAIVYPEYFASNSDVAVDRYRTENGIYDAGCGLANVTLSWGHDEYMYLVAKDYLPEPALYMIRYHSFYPGHSTPAYDHLLSSQDREMFVWVRGFNQYDLYTKHDDEPDAAALEPYYRDLISRYFPAELRW